jgi:gluconolactonase
MTASTYHKIPEPSSVQAEVVLDLDFYAEGPVVDTAGNLFFTDLAGQRIWRYKDNVAEVWAYGTRPNGQVILKDGSHLICDSVAGWVAHHDEEGKLIAKIGSGFIENLPIQCPSDIDADQHGFYFTDSVRYRGAVFYVGFDGIQKVVAQNIDYPNGVALSPDGNHLLIAESYSNKILLIGLDEPGHMDGEVEVFATLPDNHTNKATGSLPDGIAFDPAGRLWVAHYGMQAVQVLSPSGDLLATYDTGIPLTSNLCFSGSDIIVTGGFDEPGPGRVSKLQIFG